MIVFQLKIYVGGGMLAGLGATMAQGFAFGTGSAIAREGKYRFR
jgi:hypothetical protein